MLGLIGFLSGVFRWIGTFRGLFSFIIPVWSFIRGRMGNASASVGAR